MKTIKQLHPRHIPVIGWIPWNGLTLLWLSWISLEGVLLGAALTFFGLMTVIKPAAIIIQAVKNDYIVLDNDNENQNNQKRP